MHTPPATTALAPPSRGTRRNAARLITATLPVALTMLSMAPASAAAPTPGQQQPPGTQGLTTMLGWGGWLVSFVCVAGLLVVAAMMAL